MKVTAGNSEQRFAFGRNWAEFRNRVDKRHILVAHNGLIRLLKGSDLRSRSFLDIGSGSGIMSLAAYKMGARVTSFDYDEESVKCTERMRGDSGNNREWRVLHGSVLDNEFMNRLGTFDIVYSWGVLHHTGRMWDAIDLASKAVRSGGLFALAIYNDQGWISRAWLKEKQLYCSSRAGRAAMLACWAPVFAIGWAIADIAGGRSPTSRYSAPLDRGMRPITDLKDWLGGLPFEVASPDAIRQFLSHRGFVLENEHLTRGLGCNEFVFRRLRELSNRKS